MNDDDWAGGGPSRYDDAYDDEPQAPQNVVGKPGIRQVASFGPSMQRVASALVLGRFLPPHRGHMYVIDTARAAAEKVRVLVVARTDDPLPRKARTWWLRSQFPDVEVDVCEVADVTTAAGKPSVVFGSEPEHETVARAIGATYAPIDPSRVAVPTSGTALRTNIVEHFAELIPTARPYFVRRVAIVGAESTGKTTLANQLRAHFKAALVPEWTRTLVDHDPKGVTSYQIQMIARMQIALEDAVALDGPGIDGGVMFCDTDLMAVYRWAARLFSGSPPAWIHERALQRPYDLYLHCMPDIPFIGAPARDLPQERREFADAIAKYLTGLPVVELYGSREVRLEAAADAVIGLWSPSTLLSARGERLASVAGWL